VDLVRDILDKLVLDRGGVPMGRVDGVVLDVREGQPPVVAHLETGPQVLGHRLHPVLGRWVAAAELALGLGGERPVRIPFSRVRDLGVEVRVDLDYRETGAAAVEHWLRRRLVGRLPGSGRGRR
jgi:hypothetical protein